jgi:hypothetical protein
LAILKNTEGEGFSQRYEIIKQGSGSYSTKEYLEILRRNAFDFIMMWGTKTFIAISFDGGKAKVSHLLISYISLFLCLNLLYRRCRSIKDLLNQNSILVMAIVSTIAAPVFLFIDMRYIITLQGFIVGFALLDDYVWSLAYSQLGRLKGLTKTGKFNAFVNTAIPYKSLLFTIYLLFCFMLYGALLEIPGSDPYKVLFVF